VGAVHSTLTVQSNAAGNPVAVSLSGSAVAEATCMEGEESYERCWANGRPGYRRLVCHNGEWVSGPCRAGEIP
jgi:hypothetical protein